MLRHGYRRPEIRRGVFEGRSVQTIELRPRDANYFVSMPVYRYLLSDYVRIAAEPALPCLVAEHDDWLRAGYGGILGQERAADSGLHAQHGEVVSHNQPDRHSPCI